MFRLIKTREEYDRYKNKVRDEATQTCTLSSYIVTLTGASYRIYPKPVKPPLLVEHVVSFNEEGRYVPTFLVCTRNTAKKLVYHKTNNRNQNVQHQPFASKASRYTKFIMIPTPEALRIYLANTQQSFIEKMPNDAPVLLHLTKNCMDYRNDYDNLHYPLLAATVLHRTRDGDYFLGWYRIHQEEAKELVYLDKSPKKLKPGEYIRFTDMLQDVWGDRGYHAEYSINNELNLLLHEWGSTSASGKVRRVTQIANAYNVPHARLWSCMLEVVHAGVVDHVDVRMTNENVNTDAAVEGDFDEIDEWSGLDEDCPSAVEVQDETVNDILAARWNEFMDEYMNTDSLAAKELIIHEVANEFGLSLGQATERVYLEALNRAQQPVLADDQSG